MYWTRASGPYTITSSDPSFITGGALNQPQPVTGRLYIDTGIIFATYRGKLYHIWSTI